jgi:hypothetical protein
MIGIGLGVGSKVSNQFKGVKFTAELNFLITA